MAFTTECPYCGMPALETGFAMADGYACCHLCGWTEMYEDDAEDWEGDSGRFAVLVGGDNTGSGGVALRPE